MPAKGPRPLKGMHIAFGIASVILLVSTVFAFWQDHHREYVSYQEQYDRLELGRLENERRRTQSELEQEDLKQQLGEFDKELQAAEQSIGSNQAKLVEAQKNVSKVNDKLQPEIVNLNFLRAEADQLKYEIEHNPKYAAKLEVLEKKIRDKFNEVEKLKAEFEAAKKEVEAVTAEKARLQRERDKMTADRTGVDSAIRKLVGNPLINLAKDAPGLDFVGPRRHIEQKIVNGIPVDMLMAKGPRYDRCETCHKAIMNSDPIYTERDPSKLDPVMRSHPRLDLFLDPNSKHSADKIGCTTCHLGKPMGTTFERAAHSPRNAEQAKEWEHKYDWKPLEFWDLKMLPLQYTEASCLKCHKGVDEIPQAAKLNEGRHLFIDKGCTNCHMGSSGDPDMAWVGRVGPDLRRIGEKTNADWARHWIENPWDFRPSTKMPRFFGLENRKDLTIEGHPRDPVEVEAITQFIFTASKLREQAPAAAPSGNADEGKKLFASVGCAGCHTTLELAAAEKFDFNQHGPDLSRVGKKLNSGWLYQWVKNPRHYWAETKMPNLRLSDKEAADVTAYLMSMKAGSDAAKPASFPEAAFDGIIKEKLRATATDDTIAAKLQKPLDLIEETLKKRVKYMTGADGKLKDTGDGEWTQEQIDKIKSILGNDNRAAKVFMAGDALIQHHGCFGCHNIQGWTYSPLTCVNLSTEGDKDLDKLDFGKAGGHGYGGSIPGTRWDWFYAKIARPRVYDMGKTDLIKPFDRLRMPWFGYVKPEGEGKHGHGDHAPEANKDLDGSTPHGLTEEQIQALVTHLLSLTQYETPPIEMQKRPSAKELAIDRGHRVVKSLNCTGCHLVGITQGVTSLDASGAARMPMEAFIALTQAAGPKATSFLKKPNTGIFADEDIVNLGWAEGPEGGEKIDGFINILKGTYLTGTTAPIMLSEKQVRSHVLEPWEPIKFATGKQKAGWVSYADLVPLERFKELTKPLYEKESDQEDSYKRLAKVFVDKKAYERLAGSEFMYKNELLTKKEIEDRRATRKVYERQTVKVRFSRDEGRIIEHIIKFEKEKLGDVAGQQQAPPSLSYEGGKVQPDWLYQFLHNVHTLRVGLTVRMPSFWTDGPYSSYKSIYPAGRLSAVNPVTRPRGVSGEPLPGPEAPRLETLPDDAAQIVEFFIADAGQKPFGYQPTFVIDADRKMYDYGKALVTEPTPPGGKGMGCYNCHGIGNMQPPEPKWAPNLLGVKRRLKDDWVKRFVLNPAAIYPWTNMPNNFQFDWDQYGGDPHDPLRGLQDNDPKKFKEYSEKLKAVRYYLFHAGEAEVNEKK